MGKWIRAPVSFSGGESAEVEAVQHAPFRWKLKTCPTSRHQFLNRSNHFVNAERRGKKINIRAYPLGVDLG